MANLKRTGLAVAVGLIASSVGLASPVEAHKTGIHDNCTNFNRIYEHGVGTKTARDRGASNPVRNFKRSNELYWRAERHNSDLDRDNDRVACEKR